MAVNECLQINYVLASLIIQRQVGPLSDGIALLKLCRKSGKGRTDWDLLLPMLLFAYRDAVHEATVFTPFPLIFGHILRGPLNIIKEQWEGMENLWLNISLISMSIWKTQPN